MINVVFVTDNNYFKFALTAIKSILRNTKEIIEINCITLEVSEKNLINAKENFCGLNVNFIEIEDERIQKLMTKNHVSKAAFIKVLLPEIFANKKRIIFLDSDLILHEDIKYLWNEFDEKYTLQAVWNPGYNYDNKVMGLNENDKTFNSGVMLLNLEKMRNEKSTELLLNFLIEKNHLTKLNDQAAFNAIFALRWGQLPLKWNVQYQFFFKKAEILNITRHEQMNLLNSPGILHFTSNSKPWQSRNIHPFKSQFIEYYEEVNGKLKFSDRNIKALLQKIKEFYHLSKLKF